MKKEIRIKLVGFNSVVAISNLNSRLIPKTLEEKYEFVYCEDPDYLVCCDLSKDYLKYDCVRIYYTGENICPDFNAFDYAIGFEKMNFRDRYLRYPLYNLYSGDLELMMRKHLSNDDLLKRKGEFCSFVVSKGDAYADKRRELFFRLLSEYKQVNSGGRFLNNIGQPDGVVDKLEFQRKHKFAIAFENVSHDGYVTEKIVQAFAAKTIPIYWGDPNIGEYFNEKAFINCHSFNSFEDVVKRVKEVDSNDELYYQMINEPAMRNMQQIEKDQEKLEQFFDSIFSKPLAEAFRRDRVGYGKKICEEYKQFNEMRKNPLVRYSAYLAGILSPPSVKAVVLDLRKRYKENRKSK